MIPEVEKPQKSYISEERNIPHKYITRSSTKRVNHVKTFKTTPNMFKTDVIENIITHKGTEYLDEIEPKTDTITVEPISNHINCKTTGKILGYRDLVKMDAPLWKKSMCSEIGCLSQGWVKHAVTDTI